MKKVTAKGQANHHGRALRLWCQAVTGACARVCGPAHLLPDRTKGPRTPLPEPITSMTVQGQARAPPVREVIAKS